MIEKREIKKIGIQKIQKENWSHQDTYDFIEARSDVKKQIIARKLSKVPTNYKLERNKKNLPLYLIIHILFVGNSIFNPFPEYKLEIFYGTFVFYLSFIFYLKIKLKTKYKVSTIIDVVNGENVYTHVVTFEKEKKNYEDVLDADLDWKTL